MHPDSGRLALKLHDELTELTRFRALLAQESALLQSTEIDSLPDLTTGKAVAAARLGELLKALEALLSAMNHGTGRSGMDAWLATLPDAVRKENAEHWARLLLLGEECRNEHELNGKLIAIRMAQNQKAMTALLSAGGQPLTYGPDGHQRIGTGGGRTLGSA